MVKKPFDRGTMLVEELPWREPEGYFGKLKDEPFSFFLDSGMDPHRLGRYSFMGCHPFLVLCSRGRGALIMRDGVQENVVGNPFDLVGELFQAYSCQPQSCPVPFVGGAVGYFSYDLCHFVERLPCAARDDLYLPDCYLAFYDTVAAFDMLQEKAYLISSGFPEVTDKTRQKRAEERLKEIKDILSRHHEEAVSQGEVSSLPRPQELSLRSNFTREGYVRAVERVREYIAAGDVFQVNLSQRFEAPWPLPPYELYRRLRRINPAPFACYLNFDGVTIASASPERFLQVRGGRVETRPIKGTRRRGSTPAEDTALAAELLGSGKDRAENVMIVDLERNDLGRVCQYGSIRVPELAILETFPTVFHLTSTIEGRLREGSSGLDLLRAAFPGGSITGAPKVRAMEIIDELEPTRRNLYTGSIGYLGFNGDLDLNIAIRTIILKEGKAYFQAGGGIVYDSDPEAEYTETLDKARALVQALGLSLKLEVKIG